MKKMKIRSILAASAATLLMAASAVIPAAAKCKVNYTPTCTRAPFSWTVKYNDHPSGCTVCDHYVADRTRVYDHDVTVWNDEKGSTSGVKSAKCGCTAKATVSCGLRTKNRYLTYRIRLYLRQGTRKAIGDAGRRISL